MKAKLIITIVTALAAASLQAQINVGVNYISGLNSSAHSGTGNTNDGINSSVGGQGNAIALNSSYNFVGGGSHNASGGSASTIAGGASGLATNFATVGGGLRNQAIATAATIPGGAYAVANHFGQFAYSSQKLAVDGDSQTSIFTLRTSTSSATETELSLSTTAFSPFRMTLGSGAVWTFRALITAKNASTGATGGWEIKGLIKNIGGTTTLVGVNKSELGKEVATWNADVAADDTNDALIIKVTGDAASTVSWVAAVNTAELN
jgi:hypothetical protein